MKKILFIVLTALVILIASTLVFVKIRTVSSGSAYMPDAEIIEKLEALEVRIDNGVHRFDDAWMIKRGDNTIIYLTGTPYEMGYQHGILLKDEIKGGVVPVFSDPISKNPLFADKPWWMKRLMMLYLELTVYAPIERNTPEAYLMELKGIADGAGLDFKTVFIANFLSDLSMAMIPGVIDDKASDLGLGAGRVGECSSLVVSGPGTLDGNLIFGRNTDYSGQGLWGQNQTIFFYEPKDGYRYVKISTAGLIKCNSAMNEMGMVIGGHFMGFEGSRPDGVSFTVFENEIMRKTKNIFDAIDILKNSRRGGSFGLLIADGKERDAVVVESSPETIGLRWMDRGSIVLTNFATTDELKPKDLMARYNLVMRNLVGRYTRMELLIEGNHGQIMPETVAEFMSDHLDVILDTERATGITVCAENNVTSVVFLPKEGYFWVATGSEPACKNEYLGFDFNAVFDGEFPPTDPETLIGYVWEDNTHKEGLLEYMNAYLTYSSDFRNKDEALEFLYAAIEADPTEPIYQRMSARLLIYKGEYDKARGILIQCLEFPQSPNERAQTYILLAQVYDLLGKREEAVFMYGEVVRLWEEEGGAGTPDVYLLTINDMLYGIAKAGIDTPFTDEDIPDIPIGFHLETGLE